MLNVVPLGDDHHVVPVIQFEQFLEAGAIDKRLSHFLAILAPSCFLTYQASSATSASGATFVVDESRDTGQYVLVANFMLVAADDPLVTHLGIRDVLGTVLDARVVGGVAAEGKPQFEILGAAFFLDDKGVSLSGILGRGFTSDSAVFN